MNLLFISGLIEKSAIKDVLKKSKIFPHAAANAHQYAIVNGLARAGGLQLRAVSTPFVGTFPREFRQAFLRSRQWVLNGVSVFECGGANLFGVRTIWRTLSVFRAICAWRREYALGGVVILYSMITPFLLGAAAAKKLFGGLKVCLYVPDLPEHYIDNARRGPAFRLMKRLDCRVMQSLLGTVDGFVILTEAMNERINTGGKPYAVIEAIVSREDMNAQPTPGGEANGVKHIVYTGKLDLEFGVKDLADAFMRIPNDDFILDFYGDGNAVPGLQECAKRDGRIRLHGTVSREEALRRQQEATVLVNPRNPEREFTAYSFPSKTVEYLLSGRPAVMHRLSGIPAEYDPYITYFPSADPGDMARTIASVALSPPERLRENGILAREFVLRSKNEDEQAKKFLELLNRI